MLIFRTNLDEAGGQLTWGLEVLLPLLLRGLLGSQAAADLDAVGVAVQTDGADDDLLEFIHLDVAAAVAVVLDGRRQPLAVRLGHYVLEE